jgi:hypothetical protein
MFYYIVNKNACKRYQNEKQPLFQGQMGDKPSYDILFIKPPYIISGKDDIPDDEHNEHGKDGREKSFPTGVIMYALIKTKDQWGEQCNTHQDHICVFAKIHHTRPNLTLA